MLAKFIERNFKTIHEINLKYSKPRLVVSRPVRICLLILRCYLLFLVLLLLYKFITVLTA
ncbi:MAG: hypothetical protein HQK81_05900 [Desulfovibrionaceae bacterium]|nr:hypothetical protein [Desulfovibrionaceae bacterium]MBF0513582.1 hypothetical protein [Desulfovibrionaceae bacterium]